MFRRDYVTKQTPVSLYALMRKANVIPTSQADEARLGQRPSFTFERTGERFQLVSDASLKCPGQTICSSAIFGYELDGHGEVAVDFPSRMTIVLSLDDGMDFAFNPPLAVRASGSFAKSGLLTRIVVSEQKLSYTMSIEGVGERSLWLLLDREARCP